MNKMKIEIWSDIACPYCYIGKRKLENALDKFANKNEVELVWHSYELNPKLPKKALDESFYTYFARTHGISETEAKENMSKVVKLAKEVGLDYNFEKLIVANTSDALRLVKLAKTIDSATEAEEILFKSYFVEGQDVSDKGNLITWGKEIGLREDDIIQMLESDRYLDEIKKDIEYSENELNLEYIPFYVFNNKQIVQGSISPEEYLRVLTQSFSEWEKDGISSGRGDVISGQSCSIDGHCS